MGLEFNEPPSLERSMEIESDEHPPPTKKQPPDPGGRESYPK